MGLIAPPADLLLSLLATFALAVAYISIYRERRYCEGRLRHWQDHLGAKIEVLQMLIADGQDIQRACLTEVEPMSAHQTFVERCDGFLREQFSANHATRIDTWPAGEWTQPPALHSDAQVFVCYDIERRLAGLKELLAEVEDELRSLIE
jgi:hypothetical protein